MRRQAELKAVSREKTGRAAVKSVKSAAHEALPVTTVEKNILSTLNEMERMMEDAFHRPFFGINAAPWRNLFQRIGGPGAMTPAVDIVEEKGEVVLRAELPGMKREDISVQVVGHNIIISGEKRSEEKVERKDYLRLERSYGSFNRTLGLPEGIDTEEARASFKEGVLEVRFPRTGAKGSARQIAVE
ncbi:MAG TPA: Hsp20/alpha crystallin family protein [Geobacteraceae bacterium]